MWKELARFVIRNRIILLVFLLASSAVMGYYASKIKLSYEFSKAIPTDNPRYRDYVNFKQTFGDDGNLLVIGIQTKELFSLKTFRDYRNLHTQLKNVPTVEDVLSVPAAVTLLKDSAGERLNAARIFSDSIETQAQLDSAATVFYNLPFYRSLLYNPETNAWLMGVRINKEVLNSKERSLVVSNINSVVDSFSARTGLQTRVSGLPLIRTVISDRVQAEMKLFLFGSLLFSLVMLLLFFRSLSTTLLSLSVVIIGVIWTIGITHLCGYKITLLTALIPSLVVVIGIPNCIYFINKYHSSYIQSGNKDQSLIDMVSKMGVVTLFCNIAAAIGFAVFAFTKSAILKEFGVVAGLSIMVIFFISFILLPSVLSLLPPPGKAQLKYLNSRWITNVLTTIDRWAFNYKKQVLIITGIVLLVSIAGILRLQTVGKIVDDLPKDDIIYKDLKFFEQNFKGVMPLEIVVDTKKKRGLSGMRALNVYNKVDSLAMYIAAMPQMNRPLSIAEGLKFAKQGFYEGDTLNYALPNAFDGAFVGEYLRPSKEGQAQNNFTNMLRSFIDSNSQSTRLSVSMADVGTKELPPILDSIQHRANELFDSSYKVTLTGTSITFLEGSRFIINGLKESIGWAFLLIAICMLYLFRSFRILVCSLIPNLVPLVVTAGIMGWAGVPLKPSTVLVFSVALGIAVDITIRFLVNYKQVLPLNGNNVPASVRATISQTGLSIIYTSLVLTAGFVIFCASSFGGTFALGWLTSITLLVATLTNLLLLPVLLLILHPVKASKASTPFAEGKIFEKK
jgi:predicted RND superfamily exporter protein